MVAQLLDSGSDVNFQDLNGATPLILALCLSGSDSCVEECNGPFVTMLLSFKSIYLESCDKFGSRALKLRSCEEDCRGG